jgi:hypothetical protein
MKFYPKAAFFFFAGDQTQGLVHARQAVVVIFNREKSLKHVLDANSIKRSSKIIKWLLKCTFQIGMEFTG